MLTFVFTLLFVLPIGILDAYVIRDMWLWFAVPAHGGSRLRVTYVPQHSDPGGLNISK